MRPLLEDVDDFEPPWAIDLEVERVRLHAVMESISRIPADVHPMLRQGTLRAEVNRTLFRKLCSGPRGNTREGRMHDALCWKAMR